MGKFIAFYFILIYSSCIAQATVSFGFKGGVNLSNLLSSSFQREQLVSPMGGVFMQLKYAHFAMQPELLYSPQGAKGTIYSPRDYYKWSYQYVSFATVFKYFLFKGINVQVAPQIGLLAGATAPVTHLSSGIWLEDVQKQLKPFDYAIGLGFGWDSDFGLCIDLRFISGLSENSDTLGAKDVRNQFFQVAVGYKKRIGR